MIISTRGRYALWVMRDLAEHQGDGYIPLKDVAERKGLSHKYVESIMGVLSKAGLLDAIHGRGGGYRLNRPPSDYALGEILRLTEGDLAPVSCLEPGAVPCQHEGHCTAMPVWDKLYGLINSYLDSVTLDQLMDNQQQIM